MDAAWTQAYAAMAQVIVGFLQSGLIAWGLWLMHRASGDRNKQLDQQGTVLAQHGRALDQHGRALEQQGKALEQQGKVLESIGLGIQELLKRTA